MQAIARSLRSIILVSKKIVQRAKDVMAIREEEKKRKEDCEENNTWFVTRHPEPMHIGNFTFVFGFCLKCSCKDFVIFPFSFLSLNIKLLYNLIT